jgi:hypothetical protein
VTPGDEPLPPPLPIRVRPATGETTESYIRRLSRANHLRPSLLQVYVRSPGAPTGAIRLRRLAAASGTAPTALSRALVRLPPASEPRRPAPPPAESQAARKARLFGIIRDDAAGGMSIRQIAGRHHVHRAWSARQSPHLTSRHHASRQPGQPGSPAPSGTSWTSWPESPSPSGRSGPR